MPIGDPTLPMTPEVVVVAVDARVAGLAIDGLDPLTVWKAMLGRIAA